MHEARRFRWTWGKRKSVVLTSHFLQWPYGHKELSTFENDNCGGQNKNGILLFTLNFLMTYKAVESVEQNLLVSGRSFLPCDHGFALIEKQKRVVSSARYNLPYYNK